MALTRIDRGVSGSRHSRGFYSRMFTLAFRVTLPWGGRHLDDSRSDLSLALLRLRNIIHLLYRPRRCISFRYYIFFFLFLLHS